eukprot:COSAG02_NODE_181_length_30783_cov_53.060520_3_plen_208_part_00
MAGYDIHDNFFFIADAWKMDYVSVAPHSQPGTRERRLPWLRLWLRLPYSMPVAWHAFFALQGGHDSKFRDNIVYHGTGSFHGGNDGQNCVNAWPMVPGHGCEWTGNKCVLPRSNNLFGLIAGGCDCPGPAYPAQRFNASNPSGPGPQSECGVKFGHNEYFTHNGSATANRCGDFDTTWKGKNEPDSTIASLPTDEQLLSWAREKLNM